MLFDLKRWILLTSIAVVLGADKERSEFKPLPAADYPNHQTASGITVAAAVYETDDQTQTAFGKTNPYKYGILPILVVIQNGGKTAIRVDRIKADYIWPDRTRVEATPANEIKYLHGAATPKVGSSPIPGGIPRPGKSKQPLAGWEIEGRAFAAKMIPPGETASGFFYFQAGHRSGSTLYLSGLADAATKQDLIYFELPLANVR
jgi:hypothetical protein